MLNSTYYVKPLLDFHDHGIGFMREVVDLIPNYVKGREKVEAVEFEDDPMEDVEFSEIIELLLLHKGIEHASIRAGVPSEIIILEMKKK